MPATEDDIKKIFEDSVDPAKKFAFSALVSNDKITVPVDGDRFFNKHLAVVGSTGAGKSHTIPLRRLPKPQCDRTSSKRKCPAMPGICTSRIRRYWRNKLVTLAHLGC
ncbi:helicase HerA domain-containing protein [Burkholderia anthina]|uniref:helicase HerA domain-containing protein n=1 Tax=Burkholderia anthina TaxID=179879 RepID=UPI001FC7FEBE|nr:DUF87 domain-containing protein [Burkholderia anthina]